MRVAGTNSQVLFSKNCIYFIINHESMRYLYYIVQNSYEGVLTYIE